MNPFICSTYEVMWKYLDLVKNVSEFRKHHNGEKLIHSDFKFYELKIEMMFHMTAVSRDIRF